PYAIVAPADGIITDVSEEWELPDGSKGFRISIFLSIFDVHINRSPVDGRVVGRQVLTGKHLDARNPLAHQSNQSLLWEIELGNAVPDGTKVWVKQIAGAIARRIVAWKDIGNDLEKGERIGMIRFGSRTDLFLPYGVVIVVTAGQRVRAGSTVVARWNPRFFQRTVE
ncbi:MAG: phosphatidylserine decarboxylase, partial [Chthoniobacterales bacterium]|nr:phosphatidylserine decarboxylase [Chthoniobacterales bacterium]